MSPVPFTPTGKRGARVDSSWRTRQPAKKWSIRRGWTRSLEAAPQLTRVAEKKEEKNEGKSQSSEILL